MWTKINSDDSWFNFFEFTWIFASNNQTGPSVSRLNKLASGRTGRRTNSTSKPDIDWPNAVWFDSINSIMMDRSLYPDFYRMLFARYEQHYYHNNHHHHQRLTRRYWNTTKFILSYQLAVLLFLCQLSFISLQSSSCKFFFYFSFRKFTCLRG